MDKKDIMKRAVIVLLIACLFIGIPLGIFLILPKNDLAIENQILGKTILIKNVSIANKTGGTVVICRKDQKGRISSDSMMPFDTGYLTAGTYRDIRALPIYPKDPEVKPGAELFAVLFASNGIADSNEYIINQQILKDWLGNPVIRPFRIQ